MNKIYSETYITEIGYLKIEAEEDKVVSITFSENFHNLSNGSKLTDKAAFEINDYIHGRIKSFSFPYELRGTEFQKKVWAALLEIPYGKTKTYKQISEEIGVTGGARAVGNACKVNPLPIIIPCHRAIHTDGSLGGYAGGADKKKKILLIEGNKISADTCFCTGV